MSLSDKIEERKALYERKEPKLLGMSIFFGNEKIKMAYFFCVIVGFAFIFFKS